MASIVLATVFLAPGALALFVGTSAVTLCAGHSVGMHRLLVHHSFESRRWLEYGLVYLGTLVGMMHLHDMRDWAQRRAACHDLHAKRLPLLRDACLQMHARLDLDRPPRFVLETRLADDPFYRWLEATWMWRQVPWAILFYAIRRAALARLGHFGADRGLADRSLARRPPGAPRRPAGLGGGWGIGPGSRLAGRSLDRLRRGVARDPPMPGRAPPVSASNPTRPGRDRRLCTSKLRNIERRDPVG